jgi:hypothetical protein
MAGDLFMTCRLGLYGHAIYQSNIRKSVYRVHGGGIYTSLDRVDQGRVAINACEKIHQFFLSVGRKNAAGQMNKRIRHEYEKYIEGCKMQYHEGIKSRNYKNAARGFAIACKIYISERKYISLFNFIILSIKYFAGFERNRILRMIEK